MAKTNGRGTPYIVLERVPADPGHTGPNASVAWRPVFAQTTEEGKDGQPRVFIAASKIAAIRQHTGDGENVIEGTWKAIPLSSFKGGETTQRVYRAARLPLEETTGG